MHTRGYAKPMMAGVLGLQMAQGAASAEDKFLSLRTGHDRKGMGIKLPVSENSSKQAAPACRCKPAIEQKPNLLLKMDNQWDIFGYTPQTRTVRWYPIG